MHCAFFDRKGRRLINHERVVMTRDQEIFTSLQFRMFWESGEHSLPTPVWVTWVDGGPDERVSYWPLDHSFLRDDERELILRLAKEAHGGGCASQPRGARRHDERPAAGRRRGR
jgi:hypothetical protein